MRAKAPLLRMHDEAVLLALKEEAGAYNGEAK